MTALRALAATLCFAPLALRAQGVLVAPTAVFMDHRTRGAAIEVYNPSGDAVEITISTVFGYPASDSLGRVVLQTFTDPAPDAPSATKWIEAFPRRIVLRPRERQTVRLLAKPPASLPDGEYWTRLAIDSKASGSPRAMTLSDSADIRVGLSMQVRTLIALLYRKGAVSTALAATRLRARVANDSLQLCVNFARGGNAAFLGTMRGALADSAGKQVASFATPLAVYRDMTPCYGTALPALAPGRYIAHLTVDTERDDVRRDALLPIATIRDSVVIEVPRRAP